MAHSKSSRRWLREHFEDEYVNMAQKQGYRSRALYKLDEIQQKDRVIQPGMTVVDLGAAPGSWSQYASRLVGTTGQVVATDILPMEPVSGVFFVQGDFREDDVLQKLLQALGGRGVDLVMSDMAPNISGMQAVDQPRAMYLAELAVEFAQQTVRPSGGLLVKVFQGEGFDALLTGLRSQYRKVVIRKPRSSRARSREVYVLAGGGKI